MAKKPTKKRPTDANQLAKLVVDQLTGDAEPPQEPRKKNPAAVALGRLGGLKGGPARAEKLTAEQRSESARKAAKARWDRYLSQQREVKVIRHTEPEREFMRGLDSQFPEASLTYLARKFKERFPASPHSLRSLNSTMSIIRRARIEGITEQAIRRVYRDRKKAKIRYRQNKLSRPRVEMPAVTPAVSNNWSYFLVHTDGKSLNTTRLTDQQVRVLQAVEAAGEVGFK